ncbi:Endonuclease/exonuclease/phosphatase, partial [Glomus cerebriforme]
MINITIEDNNININNNNPPATSTITPFRLMTQNVQGLNSPTKQQQVLDTMSINNIDILGLSETKLIQSKARHIYKKQKNYNSYFNNDSINPSGSGVGIIISKNYDKYVQKYNGYKGRVIYVDLFMQGNMKLRIIQVYLNANFGDRDEVLTTHKYIITLIEQSQKDNFKIILLGDFNVSYEAYKQEYNRKGSFHWKFSIFHSLKALNLTDTIKLCRDVTSTTPYHTYIPKQLNQSPSRIDFIWISRDLILETIQSGIFHPELYNTDHEGVYASFYRDHLFKNKTSASLKQNSFKKRIFSFDTMTTNKWQEFQQATDARVDQFLANPMIINKASDLNTYWTIIQRIIMNAAITTVDNHMTSIKYKPRAPTHITEAYGKIRYLNRIITKLNFIKKRCDNYKDDPSSMIDSFLDRNKRTIIIDRVLQSNNGTSTLITDPNEIKKLTNQHFQQCAGGTQIPKEIPLRWLDQYTPKAHIDENIYRHLMSPPSFQEWINTLNELSNDKAPGPSGITNEMLKHLGPKTSTLLWQFICKCIILNDIPNAWREAN